MSQPNRRVVYPGSFNPVHYGHLDIIRRASRVFDEVIVAIYENPNKPSLFDIAERLHLVEVATQEMPQVRVASFHGLAVDYLASQDAFIMIRGLRVFSDFEYEFRMALANQRLAPQIEVINFITSEQFLHVSSTTVREIASLGGDVSSMVPKFVAEALTLRYAELNAKS
jgi:pantetheine-phosphate adenylyltransferase